MFRFSGPLSYPDTLCSQLVRVGRHKHAELYHDNAALTSSGICNSPAVFENLQDIITEAVSVLFQQSIGVIEHLSSIVSDAELGIVDFWFDVEGVSLVSVVKLLQQALVRTLGETAFLVQ